MMLRPGRLFRVQDVDRSTTAEIIADALRGLGYGVSVHESRDETNITAEHAGPWYIILIRALPQCYSWRAYSSTIDGNVDVRFDQQFFTWYRALVLALAFLASGLWVFGFAAVFRAIDDLALLSSWTLIMPGLALLAMFMLARLMLTAGDGIGIRLLEAVRGGIRNQGGKIDQVIGVQIDGKLIAGTAFLGLLAISTIAALILGRAAIRASVSSWSSGQALIFGLSLLGALCVAAAVRAMYLATKNRGVDDRFSPVAPAMFTMITITSILMSQLSFRLIGQANGELWQSAFIARDALASNAGDVVYVDGESAPRERLEHGLRLIKLLGGGLLLIAGFLWAIGVASAIKSVAVSRQVVRIAGRIKKDLHTSGGRAAASGDGFLKSFRWTFGTIWACYSIGLVAGLGGLIGVLMDAVLPMTAAVSGTDHLGVTAGTVNLLALCIDVSPRSTLLRGMTQIVLIGWPVACLSLVLISTITYLNRRIRIGRAQLPPSARSGMQLERSRRITESLALQVNAAMPRIVISQNWNISATCHILARRHNRCVIEISLGSAERLEDDELEALIAHEFSHFLLGHSIRHELLQIFGRMTLVGGAFVGALESSYGYELDADGFAVSKFGIAPAAMRRCLLKLQAGRILDVVSATSGSGERGLGFVEQGTNDTCVETTRPTTTPLRAFRESIAAWLYFYRSADAAYWHPALQDRLLQLESIKSRTGRVKIPSP